MAEGLSVEGEKAGAENEKGAAFHLKSGTQRRSGEAKAEVLTFGQVPQGQDR